MHELSLTEGIIRILEEQAVQHGFSRVKTVWLEIGALSHVDPESILFCFDAVAKSSAVARDATLTVVPVPGRAFCLDCAETVDIDHRAQCCPRCGGVKLHVTGGEEMRIKELEVE